MQLLDEIMISCGHIKIYSDFSIVLLFNVFTLNKNNERLARELLFPTVDLVTLTKLQVALGASYAYWSWVLGTGHWDWRSQHTVPDRWKVVTAPIFDHFRQPYLSH